MLRAIFRKASSDVQGRPMQAALLFLVIAAAAATLSVALNLQASTAKPYDRLQEQSNGADLWLSSGHLETDLALLSDIPGVTKVGDPYPVSREHFSVRNGEKKQRVALVGLGDTLPEFDHPVVTQGRWLTADGVDEIVMDSGAARVLDLEVGQPIELLTPAGSQTFTLVGFAVTASRLPAPINNPAFAYVLPATLQSLSPGVVFGSDLDHSLRVGIKLSDPEQVMVFTQQANVIMRGPVRLRTAEDVRDTTREANDFDLIFLRVLAISALFASGLIIANGVGGQVLSQLHDIGILKAIGFTPRQVTATLLVQNLGLSLLASIAGSLVGVVLASFFLKRSADILAVPASAPLDPALLAITVIVVALIVALFTFVPGLARRSRWRRPRAYVR